MTIDKHIYFPVEEYNKILEYSKNSKMSYSSAVCKLCEIALNNIEVLDRLDKIQKDVSYSIRKENMTFSLVKQLYSDLDFENITDPNKSKSVNEFMKKFKGDKFND